jgi:hypothetical protein
MNARAALRPALLLCFASCGFVDEVARTHFQLPEAKFRVVPTTEQELTRVVDLEREISIAPSAVGGSTNLDDVTVEDIAIAVYAFDLGIAIESVTFIVEPLDPVSRNVLATVEGIAADAPVWPEPVINEEGRARLESFIDAPQATFRLRARLVFALPDSTVVNSGTLDLRLRIRASALATR